jgi:hypothetical protein
VVGADGLIIGRIFKATQAPAGTPWMWTLAYGHHEDRTPTHGYEPTREAAMQAFAKGARVATEQRRWLYVLAAAIVGGGLAFLALRWLG